MQNQINPYIYTRQLLQKYNGVYKSYLKNYNFSEQDIDHICHNLELDFSVQVALNKKFKTSTKKAQELASDLGWSEGLINAISTKKFNYFFKHQEEAFRYIQERKNIIIATGTGSGKTESFIYPIINECLKSTTKGIKALIIYPMNALANDQYERVSEVLNFTERDPLKPEDDGTKVLGNVKIGKVTGENSSDFSATFNPNDPPTILVTNIYMLERLLVDPKYNAIKEALSSINFIVFDEIHTYVGTVSNHVRYLVNRLKFIITDPDDITFIGASATLSANEKDEGLLQTTDNQRKEDAVRELGEHLFGVKETFIVESSFIGEKETLQDIALPKEQYNFEYLSTEPSFVDLFYEDHDKILGQIERLLNLELSKIEKRYIQYGDKQNSETKNSIEKLANHLRKHPIVCKMNAELFKSSLNIEELKEHIKPFITENSSALLVVEAFLGAISYVNEKSKDAPILDFRLYLFVKSLSGTLKRCINQECKCCYHNGDSFFCPNCGENLYLVHKDSPTKYFVWHHKNKSYADPNTCPVQAFPVVVDLLTGEKTYFDRDYEYYTVTFSSKNDSMLKATLRALSLMIDLTEISHTSEKDKFHKILTFIDSRKKITQYTLESKDYFTEQLFLNVMSLIPYSRYNIETLFSLLSDKLKEVVEIHQIKNQESICTEFPIWFGRYIKQFHKNEVEFQHKLVSSFPSKDPFEQLFLDQLLEERVVDHSFIKDYSQNISNTRANQTEGNPLIFSRKQSLNYRAFYLDSDANKAYGYEPQVSGFTTFSLDTIAPFTTKMRNLCRDKNIKEYSGISLDFNKDVRKNLAQIFKKIVNNLSLLGIDSPIINIEGTPYYTLNAKYISFKEEALDLLPINKCDLIIEGHSSELEKNERKDLEKQIIKKANFDLVFATSTLEMGVDIENLSQIVLVGTPPTPSNFVQRAGRAGRGKDLRYATIINIGSDRSEHDMFYFHHPKDIISGHMRTTTHKPLSETVLRQHINAFLLSHIPSLFSDKQQLDYKKEEILKDVLTAFNSSKDEEIEQACRKYIAEDLVNTLNNNSVSLSDIKLLYRGECKEYPLPSYNFPNDQKKIFDIEDKKNPLLLEEVSTVTRFYLPNDIRYVSGKVYKVKDDPENFETHKLSELGINKDGEYKSHKDVYLQRDHNWSRVPIIAHRVKTFFNDESSETKKSLNLQLPLNYITEPLLTMSLKKKMPIIFIADTQESKQSQEGLEEGNSQQKNDRYANQIRRDGILIKAPNKIWQDGSADILCFVNALEHYIKYNLGHSDSEVGFLAVEPIQQYLEDNPNDYSYFYLYDKNNGETVNFSKILVNWKDYFRKIIRKIDTCRCDDEHGCYLCLKSYTSQWTAAKVTKIDTKNLFLSLLGEDKIKLALPPDKDFISHDAKLAIDGNIIKVSFKTGDYLEKRVTNNTAVDSFITLQQVLSEALQQDPSIKVFKVSGDTFISRQLLQNNQVHAGQEEFRKIIDLCLRENIRFIE